jgi:hypothetical protein
MKTAVGFGGPPARQPPRRSADGPAAGRSETTESTLSLLAAALSPAPRAVGAGKDAARVPRERAAPASRARGGESESEEEEEEVWGAGAAGLAVLGEGAVDALERHPLLDSLLKRCVPLSHFR